jgi:dienelactone hydrolase
LSGKDRVHWADVGSLLVLVLTLLVGIWYLMIWLAPTSAINLFPPRGAAAIALTSPSGAALDGMPAVPSGAGAYIPAPYPPTWTPAPLGEATPTATRMVRWTPLPTSTPTPKPTLDPRWQYFIAGMRGKRYEGSDIVLYGKFGESPEYTAYLIFYSSEGLRISGMMNVPKGGGRYPVIIMCHGYIHPDKYATGNDTWQEADYLVRRGYITIAPDYRSHAASDNGPSFFHIGYAEDVLNLIGSLDSLKQADTGRIGIWGHSMGGGVALKAAVVSKKVDAVAVFGSVSADESVNYMYGMGNGPGAGGAKLGSPQTKENWIVYRRVSSINYLDRIPALSIHHGEADSIVPYQWSEDLFEEAQEDGIATELYLYPGAEHSFVGPDWDLAMQRTADFFDTYVKAE